MAARVVVAVTPRKNGKRMSNFSPSVTPTSKRISGKAAKKVRHFLEVGLFFYRYALLHLQFTL